jgi:hypothetical protein
LTFNIFSPVEDRKKLMMFTLSWHFGLSPSNEFLEKLINKNYTYQQVKIRKGVCHELENPGR